MNNKPFLGVVFAGLLLGFGAAAHAQYSAVVSVAPPAPRHEVIPGARAGWIWAPGHWEWRGNQYVWSEGQWMRDREGYAYREPRWVQRGNGEWILVGNDWQRRGPNGDRDGDGIANRHDRDRDGDGVANRYEDDNRNYNGRNRMGAGANRTGPNGDLDRDGIANRNDRDRDGDGIRNSRDRYPDDRRRS
jgi:hypothetical protein